LEREVNNDHHNKYLSEDKHIPYNDEAKTPIQLVRKRQVIFSYILNKGAEALISDFLSQLAQSGALNNPIKKNVISDVIRNPSNESKLVFNSKRS